ncbi:DUF6551 family protein [Sphingobium nicotianae]|uniref:ParB N-terminal domain-containing protein n=1 Tax=Sphingobium nicotianae TaxID=2782607 RepID=A0A9X1AJX5_9SPHN|nr:DUF6551 family protein [Sphingobium nicotianae]MBT2185543.1 ParB N-terminal domain-containing protein [Sphingobium nicotianae]
MNFQRRLAVPSETKTWSHNGEEPPDWVAAQIVGDPCPNGSFLLATDLGQARVLPGHVVILHHSGLWVRSPEEVPELLDGFRDHELPASEAIGPGKATRFGAKSAAKPSRKPAARPLSFRPPIGKMPSIEWVHTVQLSVDPSYQRSIQNESSRRLIASIAANFDWRLCAPLVVSRRADECLIIIDGQHRWAAAMRRGDLLQLPCCVFCYGTAEEEARMFILANRARKAMSRLDDFHAAVAAADDDALEILELVTQAGLTVARTVSSLGGRANEVAFTSSIAHSLRRQGPQVVSAALTTMAEAFPNQPLYGPLFSGLADIFNSPPDSFDPDMLPNALAKRDSRGWNAVAKDASTPALRTLAMRTAIIEAMTPVG